MPKAAHKRSDRTCGGRDRGEYSRTERLSLSASINGLPPWLRGSGNSRASGSRARAGLARLAEAALEISPIFAWRRVIMDLFRADWDTAAVRLASSTGRHRHKGNI